MRLEDAKEGVEWVEEDREAETGILMMSEVCREVFLRGIVECNLVLCSGV